MEWVTLLSDWVWSSYLKSSFEGDTINEVTLITSMTRVEVEIVQI